ncbi:MAG: I78 family peptidase inhibitor [Pseudomonadota bacterium]
MQTWMLALPALALVIAACQPVPATPIDPTLASCGASDLQSLVGQDKTVLATMTFPAPTRIIEPGMAVTMDYSATRLNIWIAEDDSIARVTCG